VIKTSAPEDPESQQAGKAITVKAAGTSREEIRILQLRLRDAGFDPGPFDGVMGPRTSKALEEFQAAERAGKINPAMAKGIGVQY
jgi:peptidoglycan hydrolase-like protein with peptidoglycan-binding domain